MATGLSNPKLSAWFYHASHAGQRQYNMYVKCVSTPLYIRCLNASVTQDQLFSVFPQTSNFVSLSNTSIPRIGSKPTFIQTGRHTYTLSTIYRTYSDVQFFRNLTNILQIFIYFYCISLLQFCILPWSECLIFVYLYFGTRFQFN